MIAREVERDLTKAGLEFRRVEAGGDAGYLLSELEGVSVSGLRQTFGLFLLAERGAEFLLAAACPGCRVVETGRLRLGDREIPIHRYEKPGEPKGNLARRGAWFRKRIT